MGWPWDKPSIPTGSDGTKNTNDNDIIGNMETEPEDGEEQVY